MTRQEYTTKALEWLGNHGVDLTADMQAKADMPRCPFPAEEIEKAKAQFFDKDGWRKIYDAAPEAAKRRMELAFLYSTNKGMSRERLLAYRGYQEELENAMDLASIEYLARNMPKKAREHYFKLAEAQYESQELSNNDIFENKGKIMSIWHRHDDLVARYNNLRKKWFVFGKKAKLKKMDQEFDRIDDELFNAVVSSCRAKRLDSVQSQTFFILNFALYESESFTSIMPAMDKMNDDLAAMKDVSSSDTDERKEWFRVFMEIFVDLSLAPGWRLTAMTRRGSLGGRAEFFVVNESGDVCKNPLDKISITGDPFCGAMQAAIFQFVTSQMCLSWHDYYNQCWMVRNIPSAVLRHPGVRPIILKFAKSDKVWEFCDCDFSPSVVALKDDLYKVRYVTCHTHGGRVGFTAKIAEVKSRGFIGDINLHYSDEGSYTYDSGIRF